MDERAREQFAHQLQHVLCALYDPVVLRSSPLGQLVRVEKQRDPAAALRRVLTHAIETLKPDEPVPHGSRGWRVYQILHQRYIEQLTQQEVAQGVGLSVRQLQREDKIARELLADYLWDEHNVGERADLLIGPSVLSAPAIPNSPAQVDAPYPYPPSTVQELDALNSATPFQEVQLNETILEVLDTLKPLLAAMHTCVAYESGTELPPVRAKLPLLRQALLNIASMAARRAAGGQLLIRTFHDPAHAGVTIEATGHPSSVLQEMSDMSEPLEMTRQLLGLSQGSLRLARPGADSDMPSLTPGAPTFVARVELQVAELFPVLVIDDNVDARQLLQRYLLGTLYQFVGAEDVPQALALLQRTTPRAIILDVMLPRQDGWMLLGQIREHPRLKEIPVIVSTILPQRDLALALGAAEFIRKPIRRPDLLSALVRHIGQGTESR